MQPTGPCAFGGNNPAFAAVPRDPNQPNGRFGFYFINPREIVLTTGLAIKVEDVSLVYGAYGGRISVVSLQLRRLLSLLFC